MGSYDHVLQQSWAALAILVFVHISLVFLSVVKVVKAKADGGITVISVGSRRRNASVSRRVPHQR